MENNDFRMPSFKKLSAPLKALCGSENVDEAYPTMWKMPEGYWVEHWNYRSEYIAPDPAEVTRVADHNDAELKKVDAAIDSHRKKLSEGREIGLELVTAHGSFRGGNCGYWGAGYYTGGYVVLRSDFHRGNYASARKNVCDWFNLDSSCHSGATPYAVDDLENGIGSTSCGGPDLVRCPNHAAYEADVSAGEATLEKDSYNYPMWLMSIQLKNLLRGEGSIKGLGDASGQPWSYQKLMEKLENYVLGKGAQNFVSGANASYYTDKGYHGDQPPPREHPHTGY